MIKELIFTAGTLCYSMAIAIFSYKNGAIDTSTKYRIYSLLRESARPLTALDILDALEAGGMKTGFGRLYPILNRMEKSGLIVDAVEGNRKVYRVPNDIPLSK